jgi:hypothetical protein
MQAQRMATRDASVARRWHASPVNSKEEEPETSNLSSDDMTLSSTETNSVSSEEDNDISSESSAAQLNLKTAKQDLIQEQVISTSCWPNAIGNRMAKQMNHFDS